jgi:hypothetical protein
MGHHSYKLADDLRAFPIYLSTFSQQQSCWTDDLGAVLCWMRKRASRQQAKPGYGKTQMISVHYADDVGAFRPMISEPIPITRITYEYPIRESFRISR